MRIVALEEHYTLPAIQARVPRDAVIKRGYPPPEAPSVRPQIDAALADFGPDRFRLMDESGISFQVLAPSGPGADIMPAAEAPGFARDMNDGLNEQIKKKPDRLAGFAHLPLGVPGEAAKELERCVTKLGFLGSMVNGTTDGKFLDDPMFDPLLAAHVQLDVPLYIHPGIPPAPVSDLYYGNLPGPIPVGLARAGFGWHTEVAIHVMRLALSGALDRHPKLKVVIGHQGEGLPAFMDRLDETFGSAVPKFIQRKPSEAILEQVHVTTSGFYNLLSFQMLLQTWGVDKIMFSVDYPFSPNAPAKKFLDAIQVSPADRAKIAHGNADKLLKLKPKA